MDEGWGTRAKTRVTGSFGELICHKVDLTNSGVRLRRWKASPPSELGCSWINDVGRRRPPVR